MIMTFLPRIQVGYLLLLLAVGLLSYHRGATLAYCVAGENTRQLHHDLVTEYEYFHELTEEDRKEILEKLHGFWPSGHRYDSSNYLGPWQFSGILCLTISLMLLSDLIRKPRAGCQKT